MANKPPAKKFRFDSFATEFANVEDKPSEADIGDNDSGIGKSIVIFGYLSREFSICAPKKAKFNSSSKLK